jgi:rod shape-determining protein MreD
VSNHHPLETFWYLFVLLVAMGLKMLALPAAIQFWNPDWVLLVLIYWILVMHWRWGVISAWTVGLLTDVLTGRLLGQYALIYAISGYVCLKFYRRVRHFPFMQQGVFVFCCLLLAHTLDAGIEGFRNPSHFQWIFILPVISGTFIWSFAGLILRKY